MFCLKTKISSSIDLNGFFFFFSTKHKLNIIEDVCRGKNETQIENDIMEKPTLKIYSNVSTIQKTKEMFKTNKLE